MAETLSISKVVEMALAEASNKHDSGHLYKSDDEQGQETHDWSTGDPETIYSIASLYSQMVEDDFAAHSAIIEALVEKYGEDYC